MLDSTATCQYRLIDTATPPIIFLHPHFFEHERDEGKEPPMSIQQDEGWYLWENLMVMPRQVLRRAGASVPWRARFVSILVVLLAGTLLLDTSAFGEARRGTKECYPRLPSWRKCHKKIKK